MMNDIIQLGPFMTQPGDKEDVFPAKRTGGIFIFTSLDTVHHSHVERPNATEK